MRRTEPPQGNEKRRAALLGGGAAAILILLVVLFLAATRLSIFDAGAPAGIALLLGVVATILLGAGLMTLSFYSSRSGADEAVKGMGTDDETFSRSGDRDS